MYRSDIQKIIRRSFEIAADLTHDISIKRNISDPYIPGGDNSEITESYSAKYMKVKELGGFSKVENGPVFDNYPTVGWVWSQKTAPLSGDELSFENCVHKVVQVRSLDHGTGHFYEVWSE